MDRLINDLRNRAISITLYLIARHRPVAQGVFFVTEDEWRAIQRANPQWPDIDLKAPVTFCGLKVYVIEPLNE